MECLAITILHMENLAIAMMDMVNFIVTILNMEYLVIKILYMEYFVITTMIKLTKNKNLRMKKSEINYSLVYMYRLLESNNLFQGRMVG